MNCFTFSTLRPALADLESERNTIRAAIVSRHGLIDNICTAPSEAGGVGIPPPRRRGASENGPQKRAKPPHSL